VKENVNPGLFVFLADIVLSFFRGKYLLEGKTNENSIFECE